MNTPHDRLSNDFEARAWQPRPPDGKARRRWFAMGDPQTTFACVLRILGDHDLLDGRGYLHEDVGLVSIGDHFDFMSHDKKSMAEVGRDGQSRTVGAVAFHDHQEADAERRQFGAEPGRCTEAGKGKGVGERPGPSCLVDDPLVGGLAAIAIMCTACLIRSNYIAVLPQNHK